MGPVSVVKGAKALALPWAASLAGAAGSVAIAYGSTRIGTAGETGFTALRFALGLALLVPLLPRLRTLAPWQWGVAAAEVAAIAFLFTAVRTVPVATVAALAAASPLAAAAASRILGHGRLSRLALASILTCAAGAAGLAGLPVWGDSPAGIACAVASTACGTLALVLYSVGVGKGGTPAGPWTTTTAVNLLGVLALVPTAVLTDAWNPTPGLVLIAIVVVLTGGVTGMWLTLKALHYLPAPVVMAHAPLGTLFAALGAAAILGQDIPLTAASWMVAIGIGVVGLAYDTYRRARQGHSQAGEH